MIKTKKFFRTMISFLLCLTMVLPMGAVTFADDVIVCYIGTTGYPSLQNAMDFAKDGDVIWMTADDYRSTGITVTKNITIELEGHTLDNAMFKFDGDINAYLNDRKGTAKINTYNNAGYRVTGSSSYAALYVTNGAKLVISGSSDGTEFYGGDESYNKTFAVGSGSTLVINGAKVLFVGEVAQDGIFVCKNGILTIGDVYVGRSVVTNTRGGSLSYASAPSEECPLTIKKGRFAAGMWLENSTTINGNYIPGGTISLANIEKAFLYTSSGSYIDYDKTVDGTSDSNWDIWIASNLTTETEITDVVKDNTEALRVSGGGVINADQGQKIIIEPQVTGGNGSSAITYSWIKNSENISADKNYVINSFTNDDAGVYTFNATQGDNSATAEYTIMANQIQPQIVSKLYSTSKDDTLVLRGLNNNLYSSTDEVKCFAFVNLNDYDLTGVTTVDYSADGDGSVKAWFDADTGTLYVGGYDKIIAGESFYCAFADAKYLQDIVGMDMLDTSDVKNMFAMFSNCGYNSPNFTLNLGDNFDTSNVTDMGSMFSQCGYSSTDFTLNLGDNFDTSNVTNMNNMFYRCGYNSTCFTLNLGNKFNTGNVKNMGSMFSQCGYKSPEFTLNLGDEFDTSNVTSMKYMFECCGYSSLKFALDLGNKFNTSNVKDMNDMFSQCGYKSPDFTLNLGDKFDTSNVTNMVFMFFGCGYNSQVFTLNLGNKFDTSNVTSMAKMFLNCGYNSPNFTLNLGDNFNTSNVTAMNSMFNCCGKSSQVFTLDLGDKFNTSKVTSMASMFKSCGFSSQAFTLDLGDSFDTSNVKYMNDMFSSCGNKSPNFTLDLGNNYNTSNVTNMSHMFSNCGSSSQAFTLDLGDKFDTSNVTSMTYMFLNCGYSSTEFTLNLGDKFNTGKVTDMDNMFTQCGMSSNKFETLDLSGFTVESNTRLAEFATNIPVTTFIFGEGWTNANLSKRMFMSDTELKTTLIGATDNLLAYDWAADNRIVDKPVVEYTITANAEAGGTVTGGGTVEEGTSVTLTATANDGYIFNGWYDGETKVCDTAEFVVENVTADKTYTAKFTEDNKPLFDFTSIRAARVNNIVVDHENKTILMNADANVKYATIYQNQLDIIPNGTIKLADSQGNSVKQNSGSFYIYNNAGTATVLVDISVGDNTDRYSISVSFSEFVANNLRMYQRKIGSTEKDIVYGTDVGYVVGNKIYITPEAGVEYIGLTKYQGKPGNYNGIITPVESYTKYTTYEESIKSGDYLYVDWNDCIFVRKPQSGDEVSFDVNYEVDGKQSVYTVIVDFSSSLTLDSEIKFSTIRTLRAKNIVVDHTNNTITMDSDGKVNNVAIYKYQSNITNGATLTLADAKNSKVTVNPSSFYIEDDGTGKASVLVDINYGEATKQYTLNVNFFDGFDFESIRTLRAKNITVDHENKTINMTSDGKVSNVAVYQKQFDVISDGLVKLAGANGASVKENAGSFYIENNGNETASVIVDISIGKVTKQYTLNLKFSDGFDFDKIRTLRASDITVDHDAQKIVVTAERGAKNVAIYMAQTGVINGGKIAMKDEMDSKVQTNAGSYYVIALDDKNVSKIAVDVTIGGKTKTYDVEVCFPK